jgi:hypothetical protein
MFKRSIAVALLALALAGLTGASWRRESDESMSASASRGKASAAVRGVLRGVNIKDTPGTAAMMLYGTALAHLLAPGRKPA